MSATQPVVPPEPQTVHHGEPGWRRSTRRAEPRRGLPKRSHRHELDVAEAPRVRRPRLSRRRRLHGSRATGPPTSPADRAFGYTLLSVILISNLMAVLLQGLASKLGIVTGRDLAQACRDHYCTPVVFALWILCEIAIAACDLAEVIGSAIALNLLFGIPLAVGRVHHRARRPARCSTCRTRASGSSRRSSSRSSPPSASASCSSSSSRGPTSAPSLRGFIPTTEHHRRPRDALHRDRHPRRDGDAAQPLSALVDRADAAGTSETPPESARRCASRSSIRRSRSRFALFINAAILIVAAATLPHERATPRSPRSRTPTSC